MNAKNIVALLALAVILQVTTSFAAETMGRYEGRREGAPSSEQPSFFETSALTYTEPGKFEVQIAFRKNDPKEIEKYGADIYQFFMTLSRAQYEKIFESKIPVQDMVIDDQIWSRRISTSVSMNKRVVKVAFTNAIDKEITEVFKRGDLELVFENGVISSMSMTREKKRFLNIGGFATNFSGRTRALKRVTKGLALIDNAELGRVIRPEIIDQALSKKNTAGFKAALQAEKK